MEIKKSNEWICDGKKQDGNPCDALLGKFIDDNKVLIWGANNQMYEICFVYMDLICDKCKKHHCLQSHTMENIISLSKEKYLRKFRYPPDLRNTKSALELAKNSQEILEIIKKEKSFFQLNRSDTDKLLKPKNLSESQRKIYKILAGKYEHKDCLSYDVYKIIFEETGFTARKITDDIKKIIQKIYDIVAEKKY